MGMRNDGQRSQPGGPRSAARSNGFLPSSIRTYLRIMSSGASSVASTVRSAGASVASSIVDRSDEAGRDQVQWAAFEWLECEADMVRRVLLLGYKSGFQVWDVEEADDVRELVSRHDGPVSFLQIQPKPLVSKRSLDKFADVRPLLIVVGDGSVSGGGDIKVLPESPCNDSVGSYHDARNGVFMPTVVQFYSFTSHAYAHVLKFRTAVYSVRCSPRVVAVLLAAQIHCFDAATLEREYTILTNPISSGGIGYGGIGYGPLAVGPRWLAYTGTPVVVLNMGRVIPQHLTSCPSLYASPANGSLVAHYAKESSKQLAAGIANLGDMGYRKLLRYRSEILPERNNSLRAGSQSFKTNSTTNGHVCDSENAGMVIIRDIISKSVVSQFRAHTSPISALCFDPSGTLLVTASVQGHNINVFRIMPSPGNLSESDASGSHVHLYRLQRGLTNAVIQDISFSDDSQWIMISSSRGTSHLFAISPSGGTIYLNNDANFTCGGNGLGPMMKAAAHCLPASSGLSKLNQQALCSSAPPVTQSAMCRIKNGNNGWRGTVTGAAAAATGRMSSLSGVIASVFHNCKGKGAYADTSSSRTRCRLLVFFPQGCMIQYVLRLSTEDDSQTDFSGISTVSYGPAPDTDVRLVVEALQKWDICQRKNRREWEDNIDIYGNGDNGKLFSKGLKRGNSVYPAENGMIRNLKHDEKNHLYLSEAELQMHQAHVPLWAKPEIYFQVMMMNTNRVGDEGFWGGEVEIERFPTRTVEARAKDLIPVFDYLQPPKVQQSRVSAVDSRRNGSLLLQKSIPSQDPRFSCRRSCGSLDGMSESVTPVVAEIQNAIYENGWGNLPALTESTRGSVHNRNGPTVEVQPRLVNIKESMKMEAQLEFVNSTESPKMEGYFMDDDNEVD